MQTGHLYILETPLFRVRPKGKKDERKATRKTAKKEGAPEEKPNEKTYYCYSEEERQAAVAKLGPDPEITRFKGLGEISADEFKHFIGPGIRLDQVSLHKSDKVSELLEYYMGKNTMERQNFIIDNLVVEEDPAEDGELPD